MNSFFRPFLIQHVPLIFMTENFPVSSDFTTTATACTNVGRHESRWTSWAFGVGWWVEFWRWCVAVNRPLDSLGEICTGLGQQSRGIEAVSALFLGAFFQLIKSRFWITLNQQTKLFQCYEKSVLYNYPTSLALDDSICNSFPFTSSIEIVFTDKTETNKTEMFFPSLLWIMFFCFFFFQN